jgi:hypothetical protein
MKHIMRFSERNESLKIKNESIEEGNSITEINYDDFGQNKPFNFTIDVEDALSYLDDFKQSSDYPKTGTELGLTVPYTPNKFQILGNRLRGKFGIDNVEARKIVGMWFEKNHNIKTVF